MVKSDIDKFFNFEGEESLELKLIVIVKIKMVCNYMMNLC